MRLAVVSNLEVSLGGDQSVQLRSGIWRKFARLAGQLPHELVPGGHVREARETGASEEYALSGSQALDKLGRRLR